MLRRSADSSQRQEHGTRPVGFTAIVRAGQCLKASALFIGCCERRFPGHVLHLRIGADTESEPHPSVNRPDSATKTQPRAVASCGLGRALKRDVIAEALK